MSEQSLTTEVHTSFEDCEPELRDLYEQAGCVNPFLSFDWLRLWWEHFGRGRPLSLLLFREGRELVGWVPLYRRYSRLPGVWEYHFVGSGVFSNYLDLVCLPGFEQSVARSLLDHFEGSRGSSLLHLRDLNDRFSRCFDSLKQALARVTCRVSIFKLYPCPMASLGDSWPDFLRQQRDKKSRYNLRRSEKQLSSLGQWRFREIGEPEEARQLMPQLERLQEERFQETVHPLLLEESRSFLRQALPQGVGSSLSLSVLELDEVPVSFLIGFRMGEVFVDYAPAFDPALAALSAGHVHLVHLIEKKMGEGFRYFDFSKGEADYKRWWSNEETTNYLFRLGFHLNPRSRLYAALLDALFRLLLRLRERGINARLKRWAARLTNLTKARGGARRVEALRMDTAARESSSTLKPWSYQLVRDLPV
ncbi:MAG: GNAT family N-acetyltransferase, partial [Armatimonadetes bacterium]|nr:GNAT family N-acetyltransferase [Armatimonadota bacterium]